MKKWYELSYAFKISLGKVCLRAKWPIWPALTSGVCSMKRLGVFPLPRDAILAHHRVSPSSKFVGTHLHTWAERGTVRVECPAQEHNTISPNSARTLAWRRIYSFTSSFNYRFTLVLHIITAPRLNLHRIETRRRRFYWHVFIYFYPLKRKSFSSFVIVTFKYNFFFVYSFQDQTPILTQKLMLNFIWTLPSAGFKPPTINFALLPA